MSRRPQIFGKTLFVDLMMSTLIVVTALLIISSDDEKQARQRTHIQAEGKFVIVMTWPDGSRDDVDLHVMSPNDKDVYFSSREVDLMHLDHDDRGARGDSVETAEGTVIADSNEERTTIRGIIPGEYIVNAHMYYKLDDDPTPVTIVLYKLIGRDAEVVRKVRVLEYRGHEQTAFRFTLDAEGTVSDINELP
ncbi:MAG: hypothetical protein AAB692_03940, partial [Patescibacteria group bacterium]